jgi:phage terminase large subunit
MTLGRILKYDIESGLVRVLGGETPYLYIFKNGSKIWTCGMDNAGSVLSSERDIIQVCQAEELTLDDWEYLTTRCTGRGAVVPDPMQFGDCNPSMSRHWIRDRAKEGKLLLVNTSVRDNPNLYEDDGTITKQGIRTMATLDSLSGVRQLRLRDGVWATAEGAVFGMFNPLVHVKVRSPFDFCNWYCTIDMGHRNPAALLKVGGDYDGRWHVFEEYYKKGMVEFEVSGKAKEWHAQRAFEAVVYDEAAASLGATIKMDGMNAQPGKGNIIDTYYNLQSRMTVVKTDVSEAYPAGRPRLTIDPSCVNLINEIESLVYQKDTDKPVDKDNHCLAALRYLGDHLSEPTGAFSSTNMPPAPPLPAPGTRAAFVPRRSALVLRRDWRR